MRRHPQCITKRRLQQGAALILIMFMLGMGLIAFMLKTVGTSTLEFQQKDRTTLALKEAKTALIAWSASHPNWPGIMPFPDRKETSSPPNYDGKSDCVTTGLNTTHLIGMLPVLGDSPCISPQIGLGLQSFGAVKLCESGATSCDETGTRLWYAVSKNLIRTSSTASDPVINPSIIDSKTWMRVVDRNGNLISDRVAAVIIAPGPPLPNQDRSGVPDATEYLDSLQIGTTVYSNQDDDSDDEDFIMAPDSAHHPASDATYQSPYYFNDRLVYITIDELMAAVEKRAANEARQALVSYKDANGFYPYASQLGTTQNFTPETGLDKGFLPTDYQSCSYFVANGFLDIYSISCDKSIFDADTSGITGITFTSGSGSFNLDSGACTAIGTQCSCSGNGTCTRSSSSPIILISCADSGCSAVTFGGSNVISNIRANGGKFTAVTGACSKQSGRPSKDANSCTQSDSIVTCAGNASGTLSSSSDPRFDTYLASWFTTNKWQNYLYYHMNRPVSTTFQAGQRNTGVEGVLISVGRPIATAPYAASKTGAPQIRPSCNVPANYLDSVEGADGDKVYDGLGTLRTQSYNDHTFTLPK